MDTKWNSVEVKWRPKSHIHSNSKDKMLMINAIRRFAVTYSMLPLNKNQWKLKSLLVAIFELYYRKSITENVKNRMRLLSVWKYLFEEFRTNNWFDKKAAFPARVHMNRGGFHGRKSKKHSLKSSQHS